MPVGVVGVAGTEALGDVAVILAALVLVADQQRDRRAGGDALVHARQYLHRVRLLALRHMARRARLATVQLGLDVGLGQGQTRRAAVDHATDGRAMRFAKSTHSKQLAKSIAGHRRTGRVVGCVTFYQPAAAPGRRCRPCGTPPCARLAFLVANKYHYLTTNAKTCTTLRAGDHYAWKWSFSLTIRYLLNPRPPRNPGEATHAPIDQPP